MIRLFCPATFPKHQDQYVPGVPGIPGHIFPICTFLSEVEQLLSHFFFSWQYKHFLSYASHTYKLIRHPLLCPDPSAFTKNLILRVFLLCQTNSYCFLARGHSRRTLALYHFSALPSAIANSCTASCTQTLTLRELFFVNMAELLRTGKQSTASAEFVQTSSLLHLSALKAEL